MIDHAAAAMSHATKNATRHDDIARQIIYRDVPLSIRSAINNQLRSPVRSYSAVALDTAGYLAASR
jgi:hypothetical protein